MTRTRSPAAALAAGTTLFGLAGTAWAPATIAPAARWPRSKAPTATPSPVRWPVGRKALCAAMPALVLTCAAMAADPVRDRGWSARPGELQYSAAEPEPIKPFGQDPLEFDQRNMAFGQVAKLHIKMKYELTAAGVECGALMFRVRRYMEYELYWVGNGAVKTIAYRGGLVADNSRPYVGVFFGAGNRVEIRTYNRGTAYNQYGEPIPGGVINAWTAASATAPTNRISVEKDGVWSVNASGVKQRWMTGGTKC